VGVRDVSYEGTDEIEESESTNGAIYPKGASRPAVSFLPSRVSRHFKLISLSGLIAVSALKFRRKFRRWFSKFMTNLIIFPPPY
jgi:hypothetical protein